MGDATSEHVRIVPVRIRQHSHELQTDVIRCVGFRATNGESWSGPIRALRQDAVRDAHDHKAGIEVTRNAHE